MYQVGIPPNRVDVITVVEGIDFESAWNNRTNVEIDGIRIPVLGKADLIKNKRTVGRPQDLVDADLLEREQENI